MIINSSEEESFTQACERDHENSTSTYSYLISCHTNESAFQWSCSNDHLNISQWIYSLKAFCIDTDAINQLFRRACELNRLTIAQWLYSVENINIHINKDIIFRSTCKRGHIEVAQWLYSLDTTNKIDVHMFNDEIFRCACKYGYADIAKWIHSLDCVNARIYVTALKNISSNDANTLQLLLENSVNIYTIQDKLLEKICS